MHRLSLGSDSLRFQAARVDARELEWSWWHLLGAPTFDGLELLCALTLGEQPALRFAAAIAH